jgi:hypothetical protein
LARSAIYKTTTSVTSTTPPEYQRGGDKVAAGTATEEKWRALLFRTDSGVAGWHCGYCPAEFGQNRNK